MVQIFYKGGTLKLSIKTNTRVMKALIRKYPMFFAVVIAVCVATLAASIAFAVRASKKDIPTTEKPEPTASYNLEDYEYEEVYSDRNIEESTLRVVICNPDNGADPAIRTYPEIEDETFLCRIKSGTEIYVSKAFMIKGMDDNSSWVGVLYSDISSELSVAKTRSKIDQSGIVWVNGYYADAYCREKDPGIFDCEDYKIYTRFQGEYTIRVDECKLRSAPDTGNDANVYGELINTTIRTSVVYENGTNTFYGVPASAIRDSMLEHRVGNVDNDPDGIVWFSVDYAGTINPV